MACVDDQEARVVAMPWTVLLDALPVVVLGQNGMQEVAVFATKEVKVFVEVVVESYIQSVHVLCEQLDCLM